jgi:hypothetical protein
VTDYREPVRGIAEFVCVKILRTQSGVERISTSYAPRNNVVNRYGIRRPQCAAWLHDPCNIAAAVVPPRHRGCRAERCLSWIVR